MFAHELANSPVRKYAPPLSGATVSTATGVDWICEVLQHLSGISRKSKGHGQLSQFVFHQCTEFVALYPAQAKSSVHIIVAPKCFLSMPEVSPSHVPLVRRLAAYATHLAQLLSAKFPGQRFAAGFRTRRGRLQQLHAHVLSMDLASPRLDDFERRHFEDFTWPGRFLSLEDFAVRLQAGGALPSLATGAGSKGAVEGLVCHRCNARFGDAVRQLWEHLGRCEAWPSIARCAQASVSSALSEDRVRADVAALQDMGFGDFDSESLSALLLKEGSLEQVVSVLTEQ